MVMELPRDPEQPQYIQSFTADDVKGIIEFVDQYGVVVIRDVIDQRAVEWSIDAIWNNEELTSRGVRRDDPSTWERCWPRDGLIERKGWIESQPTILSPAAWANRFNGKLIAVYKALLEHKFGEPVDLRVNPDRWGVMRPLLNEEWRTDDGWLHTDQNPKLERDFVRFQGILVLTDSTENTGGFTCVPGFHCEWEQYCDRNPIDEDTACLLPDSEAERLRPEKITARPGSFGIPVCLTPTIPMRAPLSGEWFNTLPITPPLKNQRGSVAYAKMMREQFVPRWKHVMRCLSFTIGNTR